MGDVFDQCGLGLAFEGEDENGTAGRAAGSDQSGRQLALAGEDAERTH